MRETTNCRGSYTKLNCLPMAMSRGGISFTPSLTEPVQPGDRIRFSFVLDDGSQAQIEKDIIIRNINADKTSAQFTEQSYHHDLDFYLMPLLDP